MHMEDVLAILEKMPMEECRSAAILAADVYKAVVPYLEKGIHNDGEELDFCGEIDGILDEGGIVNNDSRTKALCEIYDACGFQHYWQA